MNCHLCRKELDAYREGRLPDDIRAQVEAHLELCSDCKEIYRIELLVNGIINHEKAMSPDNYLSARIMARIGSQEEIGYKAASRFAKIIKPVLIMTAMAAAIFAGVLIGDIYKPSEKTASVPVELVLIDDSAIESLDMLSNQ